MSSGRAEPAAGLAGWFDAGEGRGVIEAPEVPGGFFVHFSSVQMTGYRQFQSGQRVHLTFELVCRVGGP